MNDTPAHAEAPVISIVVPGKNEAPNLAPLLAEIEAVVGQHFTFEVVVVNDGSTDTTESELASLMHAKPWLRHIKHSKSCGKSAALRTGAMAARATLIVTLDGDGQNDPKYLLAMVDALRSGPRVGLVAGQRQARHDGGFKKLQSKIANAVRGAMLRDGTRDSGCGYKAFPREVFLALPFFDGLHRFLPALVRRDGYEIRYVDVIDRERRAGVSHYGFWDRLAVGIPDLFGVWWLIMRRRHVPNAVEVPSDAG